MSSFFLPARGASRDRKRKKTKPEKKVKGQVGKSKLKVLSEEIASDSDTEREPAAKKQAPLRFGRDSESDEDEPAQEKRLRLAREYLAELEATEREENEADEVHRGAIAHRLREDVLEQAGRLQRKIAEQYTGAAVESIKFLKGHQLPVTCVVITPDDKHLYSGSKDCCIIKWSLESGKKEVIFSGHRHGIEGVVGHTGHVLALAVSSDGKYLASGGMDKVVHIWDVMMNLHLHTFRGHKEGITGLAFQGGTHELFSCSFDRTVKIWNLDEMAYVETLYGHQDGVSAIDCLQRERPVSAGTSDGSLRAWKVLEESQLVFHGHKSSIDTVRLVNEEHMISGSQDGSVSVWSVMKKKPLLTQRHHQEEGEGERGVGGGEHWVTAVAAYPNTDLVASGSSDGQVHVWKCGENFRSLHLHFSIPLSGFVNELAFSHKGEFLVAAVGQEHRFGRWWKDKQTRNRVAIIPLYRH